MVSVSASTRSTTPAGSMTFLPKIHGPVSTTRKLPGISRVCPSTLPILPSMASTVNPVRSVSASPGPLGKLPDIDGGHARGRAGSAGGCRLVLAALEARRTPIVGSPLHDPLLPCDFADYLLGARCLRRGTQRRSTLVS